MILKKRNIKLRLNLFCHEQEENLILTLDTVAILDEEIPRYLHGNKQGFSKLDKMLSVPDLHAHDMLPRTFCKFGKGWSWYSLLNYQKES